MTLNAADFQYLRDLLYKRSGLALTEDKTYLLESRLLPVAKPKGINTLEELANFLRSRADEAFLREVTDAMTTNESMFFRDLKPFDQFRKIVLPKVMEAKASTKTIKIWSAACSNGQEPYSLAMILKEEGAKLAGWNIEIVGTDLCSKVLQKAKEGIYSQFEVQRGLPITMLMKYFTQLQGSNWQLKDEIRNMVTYKEKNLLDNIALMGMFDVILCRNVLIYFDEKTKTTVLENMAKMLPKHGYLYLGSTETTIGLTDKFASLPDERGLYITA
jgi:chemotaxis protein methyltransferase CheR